MNTDKSSSFQEYINVLKDFSHKENETRFAARQLLELHEEVSRRSSPTILELGVDRGQSTKVFLNAILPKPNANLVSVDIRDCSNISNSKQWKFIQIDSTNVEKIIEYAPILRKGIDVIYIDSLHTPQHVYKEIYGWFPYLKKGGMIFLDDVDSGPYLEGQRKDNISIEISNRKIHQLIEAIFNSNLNIIDLSFMRGSTGLAKICKVSSKKEPLNDPIFLKQRYNIFLWKIKNIFFRRRQYKHSKVSNKSFLIDVTKY